MGTQHLNDDEVARIREAVKSRRTSKTLVEGRWSVSPLNQDPRVIGDCANGRLPERHILRDITLRTVEQTPGVWLTKAQRHYLAEALIDAGVQSVQAAWLSVDTPVNLREELQFIKSLNPKVEIEVQGGTRAQVDAAADAGADLFVTYGPAVPEFHLIYGVYGRQILKAHRRGEDWRKTVPYPKNEAEHLEKLQEDVAYAKSRGLKAGIFTSMSHFATAEYLEKLARAAHQAGVDEIGIGDGASGLGPEAWRFVVSVVRKAAPGVVIATHCHNGFGLGGACALAAIQAGANVTEVAMNHHCSATGQADFPEVAAALEVLYGVSTGIDLSKLTALRAIVEDLTGIRMAKNKPITGREAWTYTEEAMLEEEQFALVHRMANPKVFGNESKWVLGRRSGSSAAHALRSKLTALEMPVSDAQLEAIVPRLKDIMEIRGRTLEDAELVDVVRGLLAKS